MDVSALQFSASRRRFSVSCLLARAYALPLLLSLPFFFNACIANLPLALHEADSVHTFGPCHDGGWGYMSLASAMLAAFTALSRVALAPVINRARQTASTNRNLLNSATSIATPSFRWVTVGEALALLTYVLVMVTMVGQGTNFKLQAHLDDTMVCEDDPSSRCKIGTDTVTVSTSVVV